MIRGYGLARRASRHELLGSWTTARFGNSACGGEAGLPEPFVAKVKALLPCKGLSAANFCSSCGVEGYRLQGFASRATLWTCYRCPKALQRPPFRMNRAFAVGIYAARRAKPCRKWPPTLHEGQNLAGSGPQRCTKTKTLRCTPGWFSYLLLRSSAGYHQQQ